MPPAPLRRTRFNGLVAALIVINAALLFWLVLRDGGTEGANDARALTDRGELLVSERGTVEAFERLSPSVVYITTLTSVRDRFGMNVQNVPQGSGSGFVWDKQGRIVTNFHVIAQAGKAVVTLADGTEWPAALVGAAPDHDLAVLQIKAPSDALKPIPVGTSNDLRVGQYAMAIGNPFGLDHSLTTGVISALDREIDALNGRKIYSVIQTDAAINPGNSGGPLIDSAGRLIGVNTAIHSPSGAYAGIGFAVPVDTVRRVVPQLISHGRQVRPGLGVTTIHGQVARRYGVDGVVLRSVQQGSAADGAGLRGLYRDREGQLRLGDVIIGVDGQPVSELNDLHKILDSREVGDIVSVKVSRDGATRDVKLALQALE